MTGWCWWMGNVNLGVMLMMYGDVEDVWWCWWCTVMSMYRWCWCMGGVKILIWVMLIYMNDVDDVWVMLMNGLMFYGGDVTDVWDDCMVDVNKCDVEVNWDNVDV